MPAARGGLGGILISGFVCLAFGIAGGPEGRPYTHTSQSRSTLSEAPCVKYPLRRNQSSIASLSFSSGTRSPISITPSATGKVSSKMLALVKLRIEKLSSHFKGHAVLLPASSYSTRTLRENIRTATLPGTGWQERGRW